MTDVATKPRTTRPGTSLRGFSAPLVLLLGLAVVPFGLTLLTLPAGRPDEMDYVRMAFASVAGCTIAILSVVGLLVDRILRRAKPATIAYFALVALVVVWWQLGNLSIAAETLLSRLGI